MLRVAVPQDGPAVVDLVVTAGMFLREDAAFLPAALHQDGSTCLVQDAKEGAGLAAVVLYRPEEAAGRAFDLTMIAVRPDLQGAGQGAALMHHVERDLR